ncbi:MAG TPA: hypothetical protein VD794_07705, partial [Flavisolibacter sp.]|nr:hypothetical protein [Flavisolibacter sp.]
MFRSAYILLLTLCSCMLYAQDKIEAERPGETQTPPTLSKKQLQLEVGFQKKQQNNEDHIFQHPEALLRFGLTDKIELRSRILAETQRLYTKQEIHHGIDPIELGIKVNFFETANKKFSSSFLG